MKTKKLRTLQQVIARVKGLNSYFSAAEKGLWCVSVFLILISFILFDRVNYLTLSASLVGVTSLIFNAKGNPIGQGLMIVFSLLYGIISLTFAYYGEMLTYLGMTAPMSLFSLISWLKHPYEGNKAEVQIGRMCRAEIFFMFVLSFAVTAGFYFILKAFHTANLIPSTISVTTSFLAVYLSFRRSAYALFAYSANDIVLIVLWIMAACSNITYLSVVICFCVFWVNDMYGFICWLKMGRRQRTTESKAVQPK